MPKVYIVSNNGYNFDKAKEYGELVFLTHGYIDVNKDMDDITQKIANILKDAKPEDYLLLVGINLICVLAHAIMQEAIGLVIPVNILHWNGQSQSYVSYKI